MIKTNNKKLFIFLLIIVSIFSFFGFTPKTTIEKQENINAKYLEYKTDLKNTNFNKCINNMEINKLIDSFHYTIEKENIDHLLDMYKDSLIKETNKHVSNGEYIMANNLINSRIKYYSNDNSILNLAKHNSLLLNKNNLEEYSGTIEHLCFNTLIAFPEKALDPKNNLSNQYDEEKLTAYEFKNILTELYNNNYILVSTKELFNTNNNQVSTKQLFLPKGKKPIILSFDNVNYKSNYQNLGEIDKIIIDRNNQLATYTTKRNIQDRIQYDNEFIVILEDFIKTHKDFSYNSARGIIFLTGEHGVLGYNTSHKNASSKYESKRALEVIKKLKSLGWEFGSNGYSYTQDDSLTELDFAKELSLWNKEIKTIIGETNLYAYPYGLQSNNSTTKKDLLIANGFRIFFENDINKGISIYGNIAEMNRTLISGQILRTQESELMHLFDCKKVYDHSARHVSFYE